MVPVSRVKAANPTARKSGAQGLGKATGEDLTSINQRWAGRRNSDAPGWILSAALPSAVKCSIRNTSSSGALVQIHPDEKRMTVDEIPEAFTLAIGSSRAYSEVGCIVARRHGDCVGVRYVGHFRTVVQQPRLPAKRR